MQTSTREFFEIIKDLRQHPMVRELQEYRQHYETSRYEHCLKVAYFSYLICKKYNLDYKSAARAGMLHDLFLYDWRVKSHERKRLHGFRHPRIALNNALTISELSIKEQDIILKHMWPLTFFLPKYKESFIVSCVDKYCTLSETVSYYKNKPRLQKIYRYAYVFFALIMIKV